MAFCLLSIINVFFPSLRYLNTFSLAHFQLTESTGQPGCRALREDRPGQVFDIEHHLRLLLDCWQDSEPR